MTTLNTLFRVTYGNKLDMNKMRKATKDTGIAFIGRKGGLRGNSGVSGYVERIAGVNPYPAGCLTVALGGSILSTYVQQRPFYTAQNVAVLIPRDTEMSLKHRLYYAMCIHHNEFRYTTFGREANRTLGTIVLPDSIPGWVDQMEIPSHEGLTRAAAREQVLTNPTGWRDYRLDYLFEVRKGRRVTKAARRPGTTRFIGASDKNNGITDYADLEPLFSAGVLTVCYNGNSVGWSFFQDEPFFACDDVNVLVPKTPTSMWGLLFVAAMIKFERSRFTYGYKWTQARMKATTIRLPTSREGAPDWTYMEDFMRGLPFSAAVKSRK